MKYYDDFLQTLTPDVLVDIYNQAGDKASEVREVSSNETMLGNQIATVSSMISIELLRRYHEWLWTIE